MSATSAYHALLVGIDNYPSKPLHGCVNDIDAVQQLLLSSRVGLTPADITRLASPHPGASHATSVQEKPATLANLRAALTELASQKVKRGDRVFVYYSGHGSRAPVTASGGGTFYRESLVPADVFANPNEPALLFDFELNALLAAIAEQTDAITVCLDCCHSAGATRDIESVSDATARFLDLSPPSPISLPPALARIADRSDRGVTSGRGECQVIAACLNHELAQEIVGADGVRHGLLTRAFVSTLADVPDTDLRSVAWSRIWQRMRAEVESTNPWQHLWMGGNLARAVFGSPPVMDDPGLPIKRTGQNTYQIEAGTLSSITTGAMLAVYGETPRRFPPVNSTDDLSARLSRVLLKVTRTAPSRSFAEADGPPFDLPPGARGRLVSPGYPERVRCAFDPKSAELAKTISGSPLLQLVNLDEAQVRVVRRPEGSWGITDDVNGAKPGSPDLFTIEPNMLPLTREILEHYFDYALPLRMATRCIDLAGALQVTLLACPKERDLTAAEAQAATLPEAPAGTEFPYDLKTDDKVCVRVRNTSDQSLRVTLLNSAASGRVELLGDQIIDRRSFYVFWLSNNLGTPFVMTPPTGRTQGIDRIVAIGTTVLDRDISYLRSDESFSDVATGIRTRDMTKTSTPPAERWTATEVVVRTRD